MARRIVHVVIGADIVFDAYTRADLAYRHARCITGADVVSCELRDDLPSEIRSDLQSEWEGDDDTPRVVDLDDIDEYGDTELAALPPPATDTLRGSFSEISAARSSSTPGQSSSTGISPPRPAPTPRYRPRSPRS